MSDKEQASVEPVSKKRAQRLNEYLEDGKNRSYFVGASTVIFFVVFMLMGVIPAYQSVFSQLSDNKKIQGYIDKAQNKYDTVSGMRTELDSKESVIEYLDYVFSDDEAQEYFITDIYESASRNNIFFKNMGFPDASRDKTVAKQFKTIPQVQSIPVNLNMEGSRSAALDFISELESSRRIYHISKISLIRRSAEKVIEFGPEREYELSITLEYFYLKEPKS